ncbi:MAG: IS3 family transposase [Christensenellaceae bacterium]
MRLTTEEKSRIVLRYQNGESISNLFLETGIPRSTLYSWLKPYKTSRSPDDSIITPYTVSLLCKHIRKLEDMLAVLQTVNCCVQSSLQDRLRELALLNGQYSVHTLCDALQVSRGTFYNHMLRNKKENKSYNIRRAELSEQIREIFDDGHQIFGAKKITAILSERGVVTSEKYVAELMQEMNLSSIRLTAKRVRYHRPRSGGRDAVKMKFQADAPNRVWVSDVTLFRFADKMYYICVIIDLYARKVIACKISTKHSTQLITASFREAYQARHPEKGLVFHSDQGAQYASLSLQQLLGGLGITQSFSPSGSPHHNAVMESFFSSMKKEELYRRNYHSVAEFKRCVFDYIASYNNKRPHVTLHYKTPNAYEAEARAKAKHAQNLDDGVQKQ